MQTPVATPSRRTLNSFASWRGEGVHLGSPCAVEVRPAAFGTGAVLIAHGGRIEVGVEHVLDRRGATVLLVGSGFVSTVEHLFAALVAKGITDVEIEVDGSEIPMVDGSAEPFWAGISAAGVVDGPALDPLIVTEPLLVEAHDGSARWLPHAGCAVSVDVDFGALAGRAMLDLPSEGFAAIAPARTFAMERDVASMRAAGRGLGATLENTVIWGEDGRPRNELRMAEEPILHKLVDAIGDLLLVGRPVRARLDVSRPSHRLHHAAIRALLGAPA